MRLNKLSIKLIDWLLPFLVGVGLFFINIKPYHDWGDDFAQYLQEAENLAQNKRLNAGSYIFNPSFPRIGPQIYPIGFPLLLRTFCLENGKVNLIHAQYLISFCGLLIGLFAYLLFISNGLKRPWALGFTLLLLYHPYFINQKSEIISDLPFAAFFLGGLFFLTNGKHRWTFIIAALLTGFAISIRSVGWVLPLGSALFILLQFRVKKPISGLVLFSGLSVLTALALNYFTGYYAASQNGYSVLFRQSIGWWKTINNNFDMYLTTLERMLMLYGNDGLKVFLLIFQKLVLAAFLIGIFIQLKKKFRLLELIAFLYIGVLLLYPYTGGYRFLLPILPIIMLWVMEGFSVFTPHVKYKNSVGFSMLLLFMLSFYPELKSLKQREKLPYGSPQLPEALALYNWLKDVPNQETVLFLKPRALAYYTNQKALSTEPNASLKSLTHDIKTFEVRYVIQTIDLEYPALNEYVNNLQTQQLVYENFRFKVWKVKN